MTTPDASLLCPIIEAWLTTHAQQFAKDTTSEYIPAAYACTFPGESAYGYIEVLNDDDFGPFVSFRLSLNRDNEKTFESATSSLALNAYLPGCALFIDDPAENTLGLIANRPLLAPLTTALLDEMFTCLAQAKAFLESEEA